mgnify:CR=1 FL=1
MEVIGGVDACLLFLIDKASKDPPVFPADEKSVGLAKALAGGCELALAECAGGIEEVEGALLESDG